VLVLVLWLWLWLWLLHPWMLLPPESTWFGRGGYDHASWIPAWLHSHL